jgi:hypothetical protein
MCDPSDTFTCTACRPEDQRSLNEGSCDCKKGWMEVEDETACGMCDPSCLTCSAANSDAACLSCREELKLEGTMCVDPS